MEEREKDKADEDVDEKPKKGKSKKEKAKEEEEDAHVKRKIEFNRKYASVRKTRDTEGGQRRV